MRNTVCDAITRAVPSPNSAVVQTQSREKRRFATRNLRKRIAIRLIDHDWTKPADLLMKKLDDRVLQPLFAEVYSGWLTTSHSQTRALVSGMLKKCHPSFLPQTMTKKNW